MTVTVIILQNLLNFRQLTTPTQLPERRLPTYLPDDCYTDS
jgi:hypothetical protein